MQFDFKRLAELDELPLQTDVDVKVVIYAVQDTFVFTAKSSGREMTKREIGLWDDSGATNSCCIDLTLWGEKAHQTFEVGTVLFIKGARVGEWQSARSLTGWNAIEVNPDDATAFQLKAKYEEMQRTSPILAKPRGGGGSAGGARKTLQEIKMEDLSLGMPPPPGQQAEPGGARWMFKHAATGIITSLPSDRLPCYPSCPYLVEAQYRQGATQGQVGAAAASRPCQKKVTQEGEGRWVCASGHCSPQPHYRYICRMVVMDHTDSLEINVFDEQAKRLFGCEAGEYVQAFEGERPEHLEEINRRALWRRVSLSLSSRKEVWQETERVKTQAEQAADVDFRAEARLLLADLQASLRAGA